jgi:DNA-binding CsgD family transcriptional regulator
MTPNAAPAFPVYPPSAYLEPRPAAPAPEFPLAGPWPLEHTPVLWSDVWQRLVTARVRYRSAMWSDGKCIVVFRSTNTTHRQYALTNREQTILLRTLRGDRQKLIANESKIAASTVANCLKSAMLKLGFQSRLDAAPLAALALSHADGGYATPCSAFSATDSDYILASAPRPDWSRFDDVTKSERQIASLIVEGKANTEIAQIRDTSVHTVENQVASLFRKLDASGRFDLLRVLYRPAPEAQLTTVYS